MFVESFAISFLFVISFVYVLVRVPFLFVFILQKSRTKSYTFYFQEEKLFIQTHWHPKCTVVPNQFSSKLDFDRINVVVRGHK